MLAELMTGGGKRHAGEVLERLGFLRNLPNQAILGTIGYLKHETPLSRP